MRVENVDFDTGTIFTRGTSPHGTPLYLRDLVDIERGYAGVTPSVLSRGCNDHKSRRISRIRPAPDGIGLAALRHHVIGEDRADERKRLNGCGLCGLAGGRLRKCSNARGKQKSCGNCRALNAFETHNSKPLAISVRGPGIGSCGRPGCRRFRCTARVLDKHTAVGCDLGMPDRWRSRRRAQCLSRPN